MKNVLRPHTSKWFESLKKVNPTQANHTRTVLRLAHNKDVCSVCGASPCGDYAIGKEARFTMRLCGTCHKLHALFGLTLQPIPDVKRRA
jgi:hypothetical protein